MTHINSIPMELLENVKEWLDSSNIAFSEGPLNLNWPTIMKTVIADPKAFYKDGGWSFLASDSDEEDGEEESEESEFEASDFGEESDGSASDESQFSDDGNASADEGSDDSDVESGGLLSSARRVGFVADLCIDDWDEMEDEEEQKEKAEKPKSGGSSGRKR